MTHDYPEFEESPDVPDPSGPPQPVDPEHVTKQFDIFDFITQVFVTGVGFVAAGGALLLLMGVGTSTCAGATRSSRLKWQERQAEIDAAQQQSESESTHS